MVADPLIRVRGLVRVFGATRVLDGVDWSSRAFRLAQSDGTTTVCIVPGTDSGLAEHTCVTLMRGDNYDARQG